MESMLSQHHQSALEPCIRRFDVPIHCLVLHAQVALEHVGTVRVDVGEFEVYTRPVILHALRGGKAIVDTVAFVLRRTKTERQDLKHDRHFERVSARGRKANAPRVFARRGVVANMHAQWAAGSFGSAAYFADEAGASVTVADGPSVQFGKSSFSLSCWLCPTQLALAKKGLYRRLLCKSSFPGTFWTLDIFDSGQVMFAMRDSQSHTGTTRSKGAIQENVWTHLAVVVDREQHATRYFFNGQQDNKQ